MVFFGAGRRACFSCFSWDSKRSKFPFCAINSWRSASEASNLASNASIFACKAFMVSWEGFSLSAASRGVSGASSLPVSILDVPPPPGP